MKHIIGFPGLFEDRYVIDRVAFDLGKLFGSDEPIYIYWYALIIVAAMILAYTYFLIRSKRTEGIVEDHTMNVALFVLPLGIVGARLFFVLTNLSQYDSFKEVVLGIREGGLAIYGGIVFGLITVLVYCRIKKLNCFKMLDALAPAVMIAQSIGRWGNFFNAEAYGSSDGVKNFLFRMTIADYETPYGIKTVHPTFLYESVWNVVGFIIANIMYRKKKVNGQIFCFYLVWYGIGRSFIELLRTDSCMILGSVIKSDPLDFFNTAKQSGLKVFVYLSILLVITGVVLYIFLKKRSVKESSELEELKTMLESEPETEAQTDTDTEAEAVTEAQTDTDTEAETETEAETVTEAQTDTDTDTEADDDYEEGEDGDDEYDDGEEGDDDYDDEDK